MCFRLIVCIQIKIERFNRNITIFFNLRKSASFSGLERNIKVRKSKSIPSVIFKLIIINL